MPHGASRNELPTPDVGETGTVDVIDTRLLEPWRRGAEVVEQIHAAGGNADLIAADLDGSGRASLGLAADATRAHGTFGTPDVIAHTAVYLAADESPFVNGTVVDVDGGRVSVVVIAAG